LLSGTVTYCPHLHLFTPHRDGFANRDRHVPHAGGLTRRWARRWPGLADDRSAEHDIGRGEERLVDASGQLGVERADDTGDRSGIPLPGRRQGYVEPPRVG
jgi:hypothetical protein